MHAGDGYAVFQPHQLSKHFRSLDDRDFALVGFQNFRVVARDGGTGHDDVGRSHLFGCVPDENDCPKRLQAIRCSRSPNIRSRDRKANGKQDLGNTAHTDATNSNKMNALCCGKQVERSPLRVPYGVPGPKMNVAAVACFEHVGKTGTRRNLFVACGFLSIAVAPENPEGLADKSRIGHGARRCCGRRDLEVTA